MELNEKQFIKGFNAGYLLAEYEPQILTALLKQIHPVNSYISGMAYGQKEYKLEYSSEKLRELERLRKADRDERSL